MEGYLEERPIPRGFGSTVELSFKGQGWLASIRRSGSDPSLVLLPSEPLLAAEREKAKPAIVSFAGPRSVLNNA